MRPQPGHSAEDAHRLRLLFWEVTAGCNLRCIHCRASSPALASSEDLSTQQALAFVDSLADFAKPILVLSGGEPLSRADLFDIAARATDRGLRVALATNGTLVDDAVARRVADVGVGRASISFDGADAPTHDAFRGVSGSFDQALRGMAHLQAAGVEVQINSTIARHNVHQVQDLLQLALDRGAVALHIFMLVPVGCGVEIADEQMIDAEQYEQVLEWFYDVSREVDIDIKATCAPHYFRIMRQRARAEGRKITLQSDGMAAVTKGCLAGQGVCFVSHRGDVQPCGYLPVKAGNVLEQDISDIWRQADVFRRLRDDDNLKGKCGLCEYRAYCMGCRARAYAETGDYLAEEPYCIYVPRRTTLRRADVPPAPQSEGVA